MSLTRVHKSLAEGFEDGPGGGGGYNHNILINPTFTVKQYGDVIQHEGEKFFGPDRWRIRGVGGTGGTLSQSSTVIDDVTGANKLFVENPGATDSSYLYQLIEAVNVQGLYGKEMTFSFSYSATGGAGSPIVRIRSYDSLDVSKTLFEAVPTDLGDNRWTCKFTLSTDDGSIPEPSEKGLQVLIYPNEMNVAPSKWYVWETKLEVGSTATPFIARQYGEELALCQRYYTYHPSGMNIHAFMYSSVINVAEVNFPTTMRASPTVTFSIESSPFSSIISSVMGLIGIYSGTSGVNSVIKSYTAAAELYDEAVDITEAQYTTDLDGRNVSVQAVIDGQELSVPMDTRNQHYKEILRQTEAKTLVIKKGGHI